MTIENESGVKTVGEENPAEILQENAQETEAKTYSEEQVQYMIQKRLKAYKDIDLNEYAELKAAKEKEKQTKLRKEQKFDELLAERSQQFDQRYQKLESKYRKLAVDDALLRSVVNAGAVKPEMVTELLSKQVQLTDDGDVVVVDKDGDQRFTMKGEPYTVDMLASDFITENPFLKNPSPSGAGSIGNNGMQVMTDRNYDFSNPTERDRFRQNQNNLMVPNFDMGGSLPDITKRAN